MTSEQVPGVLGIHHVALAVPDLEPALSHWLGVMGGTLELRAIVEQQGVEAATIEWGEGSLLELVAPHGESSPISGFLERRGAGIHHVAWLVTDAAAALTALSEQGARLIDTAPRPGLHGTPVAFVHPRSMGGVLVELVEVPAEA